MKKTFNKKYILANSGCYMEDDKNAVLKFDCIDKAEITLLDLSKEPSLPFKDFAWFFVNSCNLTVVEKQMFALFCAKSALFIYEEKYPKDKRVRNCIDITERYRKGDTTVTQLREAKRAAADAYAYAAAGADAYAAAGAAAAADAYAYAAADAYAVAYAYAAAAAYAVAAAYAAAYAGAGEVKKQIINYILAHG